MSIIDPGKRSAEEELESERHKRVKVIKDSLLLSKGCFDPTRLIEDGLLPSEGLDPAEIRLRLISHAQDLLRSEGLDPAIAVEQDWNQLLLDGDAVQDKAGGVPESVPIEAVGVPESLPIEAVGVEEEKSIDCEYFDSDFDFDGGKPLSQKYLLRGGVLLKRKKTKTKKGLANTSNIVEPGDYEYEVVS